MIAPDGLVASFHLREAFQVKGPFVIGGEFGFGKGPATFRNAGPWGEVGGVEFEDLSTPADGGSTLYADTAGVDTAMGETGDFAVVDGLRGIFTNGAATFEEQNLFAFAGELDGECDACGTGADDADVCDEAGLWRFLEEIVDHGRPARAGFAERPVALGVDRMDSIRSWILVRMSPTCLSLW